MQARVGLRSVYGGHALADAIEGIGESRSDSPAKNHNLWAFAIASKHGYPMNTTRRKPTSNTNRNAATANNQGQSGVGRVAHKSLLSNTSFAPIE